LKNGRALPAYSPFLLIVKLFNLENRIKAGEYSFSPSEPLPAVIYKLVAGETLPAKAVRVAFPEGSSIYKMGVILKDNGFAHWPDFQRLVDEGITAPLRERHWNLFKYISSESLEGYLFPDTYQFYPEASAEAMAEVMIGRFEEIVSPFWARSKNDTKMSLHEILTLASIVEKEAKQPAERPIIASVFYNRLKIGMPLAADPTVKYALERPSKIVYLDQLSVKSPYNTYKVRGLPPGPICNPGFDSIKAAVYPAKTDYLFFVAKPDGSHIFSKTWQEHQRARGRVK
ncbi:MAG: endolytic transglycosylase MltG, partial [Candidatus Margulisbacteria bacterium]|nr:endolytic transglycosylase MltG [Candidatus Margulisiibacteriota bacterium]